MRVCALVHFAAQALQAAHEAAQMQNTKLEDINARLNQDVEYWRQTLGQQLATAQRYIVELENRLGGSGPLPVAEEGTPPQKLEDGSDPISKSDLSPHRELPTVPGVSESETETEQRPGPEPGLEPGLEPGRALEPELVPGLEPQPQPPREEMTSGLTLLLSPEPEPQQETSEPAPLSPGSARAALRVKMEQHGLTPREQEALIAEGVASAEMFSMLRDEDFRMSGIDIATRRAEKAEKDLQMRKEQAERERAIAETRAAQQQAEAAAERAMVLRAQVQNILSEMDLSSAGRALLVSMDSVEELCKLDLNTMQQMGMGIMDRRRLSDFVLSWTNKEKKVAELYAELEKLPCAVRLAKMDEMFQLQRYQALRTNSSTALRYRKRDIDRSMIIFSLDDSERVLELERKAVVAFSKLLGYMGEKNYHETSAQTLASMILQDGIDNPELCDEIYLHCMVQCIENPDVLSCKHVWRLISLLVQHFSPSLPFLPHVEVFLFQGTRWNLTSQSIETLAAQKEELQSINWIAQFCLRQLQKRVKEGRVPRTAALHESEIQKLFARPPLAITVSFTDGSSKKFHIDHEITAGELLETISITLRVNHIETYGLFDVSTLSTAPIPLDNSDKIVALLQDWQRLVPLSNKPFAKKGVVKHELLMAKRLHVDTLTLNSHPDGQPDTVELHLLYTQVKRFAVSGQYNVPDSEAVKLAGLSLQIEYGDYCTEHHTEYFLRKELPKHITQRLYAAQQSSPQQVLAEKMALARQLSATGASNRGGSSSSEDRPLELWERNAVAEWVRSAGCEEVQAKLAYVDCCQKLTGYGYTFFEAKQGHLPPGQFSRSVLLGINRLGVTIFNPSDKLVFEVYRFAKLQSWASSPKEVTFKVSPDGRHHQLRQEVVSFETDDGDEVVKLLKDYALWLSARRRKEHLRERAHRASTECD